MFTSQLVVGHAEAYVATCRARERRGPNGEAYVATVWHTLDRGTTWQRVPWRRALRAFVSRALFAPWPPEYVVAMELREQRLEVEFWEDWGQDGSRGENFDTGHRTEPIWRARLIEDRWSIRLDRRWCLRDGPYGPKELKLDLPRFRAAPPLAGTRLLRPQPLAQAFRCTPASWDASANLSTLRRSHPSTSA